MENTTEETKEKKLMNIGSFMWLIIAFVIGMLIGIGVGNWYLGGAAGLSFFFIAEVLTDINDYQIKILKELKKKE